MLAQASVQHGWVCLTRCRPCLYAPCLRAGSAAANGTLAAAASPVSKAASTGWYPFDTKKGKTLLGDLDLAFLGSYACEWCLELWLSQRYVMAAGGGASLD